MTLNKKDDIIEVPKDMLRQRDKQLEKGIRNNEKHIERHKYKINHPEEFVPDWNNYNEKYKKGLIHHWEKEINTANKNIKSARLELKRRKNQ